MDDGDRMTGEHAAAPAPEPPACDLEMTCPHCMLEMYPEHAHFRCARCGYRDSCCF
ncbi:MAG: hypothetical protein ACRDJ5_06280 [Actinomycetota bacterium]